MGSTDDTKPRPFRVIMVGAGIAGLTLSNALQQAGIDHVVIEKHKQVVNPSGASIGVWPNGARLLDQLGCLESIEKICSDMTVAYTRNPDGQAITVSSLFQETVKRHAHRFLLMERHKFLQALLASLPSKEPIRTGWAVKNITESGNGVQVFLGDGSFVDGDIVVGCDGVGSQVRQMMWENSEHVVAPEEKNALTTSYKCLVGLSPFMPGIESGSMTVVHNDGFSFLILTQPQFIFYFVFIGLDQTHHWPSFPKFTADDANRQAAKTANLPINSSLRFGQLWENRIRGKLINIEEGVFKTWHSRRIVLVGDSAHKFTPNIAFGGGSAIESAATLANLLRAKLLSSPDGLFSHPSGDELSAVFQNYQRGRLSRVYRVFWLSWLMTRVQAWANPVFKLLARWCMPWLSDSLVGAVFSQYITGSVTLDYMPLRSKQEARAQCEGKTKGCSRSQWKLLWGEGLVGFGVLYILCKV